MNFDWKSLDVLKLLEIAEMAGNKIMEIYNTADFTKIVDYKSDNSPLTLADKESHKIIDKELRKLASIPVLSEEGKEISYDERKSWNYFWLVDPLDGTKEFIKKNGQFTVNIALIENGKPIIGIIYAPSFVTGYYAKKGEGTYRKDKAGTTKLVTKLKEKDWIAAGSSSHASPEEKELLKKYPVAQSIEIGSSLKFCLVAEGKADIYYRHGPTMEWDTAAGQAILECAGGVVLDKNNNPFSYNKESLLNGSFLCLSKQNLSV
jgi:3'(2'), 5'-bisphosphate nucleotidase